MSDRIFPLFDELVAQGIASPHDVELRAQIARAEAISGAFSRFVELAGRVFGVSPRPAHKEAAFQAPDAANRNADRRDVA